MVAATQGERQALLTATAVRCAASRGLRRRRRREEKGKRQPKKPWKKLVEEHEEGQSQQGEGENV